VTAPQRRKGFPIVEVLFILALAALVLGLGELTLERWYARGLDAITLMAAFFTAGAFYLFVVVAGGLISKGDE
jgi:hypothetical protein